MLEENIRTMRREKGLTQEQLDGKIAEVKELSLKNEDEKRADPPGKDVVESSNTETFLQAEKPHQVIHTAFEGSQVVKIFTAMGEEALLAVAMAELEK